jgi:mannan endo-1,4-beta-mannosidase
MRTASHYHRYRGFIIFGLAIALAMLSCNFRLRPISSIPTIDSNATNETKALFMKLWLLADTNQTLFGHQDDLFFGVGWRDESGRSDVFEVTDSYPAVYGWDVGALELGGPNNVDGVPFDTMREKIIEGYRRGGVITISWHMFNPVTGENFYDTTEAVSTILPGGSNHDLYRSWLDAFAEFDRSLTVSGVPWNVSEHLVPVIFRPFHEHNGSVFWWGGRNTNEADYIALWRFTVEYLRDTAGLHNLLYAYSPDARFMGRVDFATGRFADLADFQSKYFYAYPGDDYVDVLGLDNYADVEINRLTGYESGIDMLVQTAHARSDLKIPALTETGGQRWPDADWWTTFLYPALFGTRQSGGQVAWVLVWRNWDEMFHAAPYPGSSSADDFVAFKDTQPILFEDELPFNLYTWP